MIRKATRVADTTDILEAAQLFSEGDHKKLHWESCEGTGAIAILPASLCAERDECSDV
jgi:hypothetical protein